MSWSLSGIPRIDLYCKFTPLPAFLPFLAPGTLLLTHDIVQTSDEEVGVQGIGLFYFYAVVRQ